MKIYPLGEAAILIDTELPSGDAGPLVGRYAAALQTELLSGVIDLVPSYTTVGVFFTPSKIAREFPGSPHETVSAWIRRRLTVLPDPAGVTSREFIVPVCYGGEFGPDLADIAAQKGLSPEAVVRLHSSVQYTVRAVGFSPGFPYLSGLPAELHVHRRASPRMRVTAGSVAIGGEQAGIYSLDTPGGWNVLGRTSWKLFDVYAEPPSLFRPGDRLRFQPVDADTLTARGAGPLVPAMAAPRSPTEFANELTIVHPGSLTTVQDLGRPGLRHFGVPVGGAADRLALRMANLLVGNSEDAPALECTLAGPDVMFAADTWIAVCGATVRGVAAARPIRVGAGETISLRHFESGSRAYLGVAGGLSVAPVLGSASTYLRGGFGGVNGRALKAGDRIAVGSSATTYSDVEHWFITTEFPPHYRRSVTLRFVRGPQFEWFAPETIRRFETERYRVEPQSDRMGIRLAGHPAERKNPSEMSSAAVGEGAIQIPPEGQPILLLADSQTIGGYPQLGYVIAEDLPLAAQLSAGDEIHFQELPLAEAEKLLLAREAATAKLRQGLAQKRK